MTKLSTITKSAKVVKGYNPKEPTMITQEQFAKQEQKVQTLRAAWAAEKTRWLNASTKNEAAGLWRSMKALDRRLTSNEARLDEMRQDVKAQAAQIAFENLAYTC